MNVLAQPTDADLRRLVDACRATLLGCSNDLVKVATGVLDGDGRLFTAVQVRSRNCNHCSVCAEAIAIGMALTAGTTKLTACASVVRDAETTRVWSPCGSCRELLNDYAVGYAVVADDHGQLTAVSTTELLPWP